MTITQAKFKSGDRVEKPDCSYRAIGTVLRAFTLKDGLIRYVVEFDDMPIASLILTEAQLKPARLDL